MTESLQEIAKQLLMPCKGILAADEGFETIKKRFVARGIESTEENRRLYRQLLFTTPNINKYISGVILFDETIRQSTDNRIPFPAYLSSQGIIPGIKVDKGTEPMATSPEEKITLGLEGLADRLKVYKGLGVKFAKWRAVFKINATLPSQDCIQKNADAMAQYAEIAQKARILPIVEPDVLMEGGHNIERCYEVTKAVLTDVFTALKNKKVILDSVLLKPNMVLAGFDSNQKPSPEQVAEMTILCLTEKVSLEVPGIVFLSGGQSPSQACRNLNAISKMAGENRRRYSFSFGRALQNEVMDAWDGKKENIEKAQQTFLRRAELASAARCGKYDSNTE